MKLQLPNSVSTAQDLEALTLEVHQYARWFAQNSIKKRLKVRRASEKPAVSADALDLIRDWSIKMPLTTASLDELIAALDEFKNTAENISITLAAPAPTSLKKSLVSWCRKNIAENVLVSFQINGELLGGMVVRYGSKIYDWSFRRQILAAKDSFPEVLRRV